MELPENCTVYLMTQPEQASRASGYGLPLAHVAYRVGNGPHLFRTRGPLPLRGGVMVLDHRGYNGQGNPEPFCQEVQRECAARGFSGAFCDWEGPPAPTLRRALELLAPAFQKRRWTLYVPESYAFSAPAVKVVIPTALSGGSLRQRLLDGAETYGADHLALGLEWVAEDFTLPAADGSGVHLSREELERRLKDRAPCVYFSDELCAHYFTYMQTGESAHFVLYDDASSLVKKLYTALALGIREAFLPQPGSTALLEELLGKTP